MIKNNKNGKILNVLLAIIAILAIIGIIAWVTNKSHNTGDQAEVFTENMNVMQETAKSYFMDNLPEEIGDTTTLNLNEMYDLGIIDTLKYNGKKCDGEKSFISITKVSENEYKVKSNLVCDGKSDNVIEKIKTNTIIKDKDGNEILNDEKNSDVKLNTKKSKDGKTTNVSCAGIVCRFIQIPTECTITYEYEYVKRSVSCPEGYTLSGSVCVKYGDKTANPTSKTKVVPAKVNTGKEYKQYINPNVNHKDGYYKCTSGSLSGKYCYFYKNKETVSSNSCPSGYTKDGSKCYKYVSNVKTTTTTYSCPSGYTKSGSGSNTKCKKTTNATKSCTSWGNPTKTYSTTTKESTYTNETSKKVLLGTRKVGKTTTYTYAIYKRSCSYKCSSGTKDGKKCIISKKATKNTTTTYSCPSGYTKSDSGSNTKCYVSTNVTTTTTKVCPSGYKDNGSNCYKTTNADYIGGTTTYSCPTGYIKTGNGADTKCYKTVRGSDKYYCENSKATLKDKMCYYQTDKTNCPTEYVYSAKDRLCHKKTSETTNPIWSTVDTMYSSATSVPGYQRTGRANYTNVCVPSITK